MPQSQSVHLWPSFRDGGGKRPSETIRQTLETPQSKRAAKVLTRMYSVVCAIKSSLVLLPLVGQRFYSEAIFSGLFPAKNVKKDPGISARVCFYL